MLKNFFVIFKIVVILSLLINLINRDWTAIFICLFNFILLFVADFVQTKLKYSDFFQLLIYLFLIGSLIGGEVYYLYIKVKYFDVILHTLSSFIVSGLFLFIFRLFEVNINKLLLMLCIFSFAMMIAALWEITEFSIDRLFDRDMQKDTVITEINSVSLSEDGKSIINKKINNMIIDDLNITGYLDIGLYDTIEDMLCALIGSLLYLILNKRKEALV